MRLKPPPTIAPCHSVAGTLWADLVFNASTGLSLDLYLPADRPASLPVMMYLFGGGFLTGQRRTLLCTGTPGCIFPFSVQSLLDAGFAVAAVSYRLCTAETNSTIWPGQLHDAASAVRWLRGRGATAYGLDPDRLGCVG